MRDPDGLEPTVPLHDALFVLLGAAVGALFAALVAPRWLPDLAATLAGPSPKAYWLLSRSSGLVAYLLLWLSVALGLLITNRLSRLWPGGPTAADLHQFTGLLGLAFAVFHAVVLLGDRYVGYSLLEVLVPFAGGSYRPLWVGLGQVGFYLSLVVAFSFYARRRIGYRAWRRLHYASFLAYLLVTLHGLTAGTDSPTPLGVSLYGLTALATFFLTIFRILATAKPSPRVPT